MIAALDRAVQLKATYNIRVINLSLGRPVKESYQQDPLCRAVEAAWKAGIVVVTAAGNLGRNGSATIISPANDPYVITVGAMKTMGTGGRGDDLVASYSSKGPTYLDQIVKPDIVAPGNLIGSLRAPASAIVREFPGNALFDSYMRLSGTSMASPMVAGAAALLLQAEPGLTPDGVKARLMRTSFKSFPATSVTYDSSTNQTFVSTYDVFTVGAGYLDIAAALADHTASPSSSLSPAAVYDLGTRQGTLVINPLTMALLAANPWKRADGEHGRAVYAFRRLCSLGNLCRVGHLRRRGAPPPPGEPLPRGAPPPPGARPPPGAPAYKVVAKSSRRARIGKRSRRQVFTFGLLP